MVRTYSTCLTVAGSDSSGGAGIQADLKTMSALGVYGMSVITAITAQNTQGVTAIHPIPPEIVKAQAQAILSDISCDTVKIGMLYSTDIAIALLDILDQYIPQFIVLDPVMVSTSGHRLAGDDICRILKERFFPRATLITPNIPEAALLSGVEISGEKEVYRAGEKLLHDGCRAVLVKGGHLSGTTMNDVLFAAGKEPQVFSSAKVETVNTHGTGCSLSSAIAAFLALGKPLDEAVAQAKTYVAHALEAGAGVSVGKGHGPIDHFFDPQPLHIIDRNEETHHKT